LKLTCRRHKKKISLLRYDAKALNWKHNSKLEELGQKGQDLAGCNLRIRTLEEALSAKEPEIQINVQDMLQMPKP
jgi:hypothetical protein